jgi:uncharacterized protein (DUF433 family)
MSVATFEGIVEQGLIRLKNGASLPDRVKVYIVVPELEATNQAAIRTPVLAHPEQADDFKLEMVKEQSGVGKTYQYLEQRPDKKSQELLVRGRGVRASTIWHDRFISRFSPDQIAADRDLPLEAIYGALDYCQENWESICREKDLERQYLEQIGFFQKPDFAKQ